MRQYTRFTPNIPETSMLNNHTILNLGSQSSPDLGEPNLPVPFSRLQFCNHSR